MRAWLMAGVALTGCSPERQTMQTEPVRTSGTEVQSTVPTGTLAYMSQLSFTQPDVVFSEGTLDADLVGYSVHTDQVDGTMYVDQNVQMLLVLGEEDGVILAIVAFNEIDLAALQPGDRIPVDEALPPGTAIVVACAGAQSYYWEMDAAVEDAEVVVETIDDQIVEMSFHGRVGSSPFSGSFVVPSTPDLW